ncbi:unnamed protein product [Effrenium voratum]|nr:unnamed protein product [Effrenium voratum]
MDDALTQLLNQVPQLSDRQLDRLFCRLNAERLARQKEKEAPKDEAVPEVSISLQTLSGQVFPLQISGAASLEQLKRAAAEVVGQNADMIDLVSDSHKLTSADFVGCVNLQSPLLVIQRRRQVSVCPHGRHGRSGVFVGSSSRMEFLLVASMGFQVEDEEVVLDLASAEFRIWSPFRCVLAACLVAGLGGMPVCPKARVICVDFPALEVSFVAEIVGPEGEVICALPESASLESGTKLAQWPNVKRVERDFSDAGVADALMLSTTYSAVANDELLLRLQQCRPGLGRPGKTGHVMVHINAEGSPNPPEAVFAQCVSCIRQAGFKPLEQLSLEPFSHSTAVILARLPDKRPAAMALGGEHYVLKPERWSTISLEGRQFVKSVLEVDPNKRLTAAQALQHTWIKNRAEVASDMVDKGVVDALRAFGKVSKFRRCCMEMMAWSLSNEERAQVTEDFLALDRSQQGTIKMGDLKQVLAGKFNISNEETRLIFDALDSNHDEEIHYSDFLAAMVNTRISLHDHLLQAAFKKFDVDSSGYITASNLRDVLGETWEGEQVEKLLAEADILKDNRISYEEFKSYLRGDPMSVHQELATQVIDIELSKQSKERRTSIRGRHAADMAMSQSTDLALQPANGVAGGNPLVHQLSEAMLKPELCCALS